MAKDGTFAFKVHDNLGNEALADTLEEAAAAGAQLFRDGGDKVTTVMVTRRQSVDAMTNDLVAITDDVARRHELGGSGHQPEDV